jgi:signal transduction histidine kinase/ActR/RegA family two-component response regulator
MLETVPQPLSAVAPDVTAVQVETLTQLHELAMRLGGISELQPALDAILDTAVRAQGADFGLVWLHDTASGHLVAQASHGFSAASLIDFARVTPGPGGGSSGNAFAAKCRWIIEDTETDALFEPFRESARAAGFRAVHSTPIVTRDGALLGVVSVHFAARRRPSKRDMQVADVCACHAADAIEASRGLSEMKKVENELRELDQRKNEFLATLAHELRNPLAPLRNGLEVMRLAAGNPATVEKARGMMERQLAQMVHLVDDLLDVSRVSRGKVELRREQVELASVLRSALETSQPLMTERGHELVIDIAPQRVMVNADMMRLSQVFWNLLNNAAKYTEPGGRIEMRLTATGGEASVSIRDNGIGIPREMQSRVFDIFTQVDRSLEKSQGGLGIGLSIAKRLVEMHGGTITVASGGHRKGSEFVVRLPATLESRPGGGNRAGPLAAAKVARHRILVADDNADSATTLSLMLEVMGNEVLVANDGQEAVDFAASFNPDTILMDIGMPRMNGYEACEKIRAMPGADGIYMVALTGWGQDEDKARSHAAGFDRHLVKPVEPLTLERMIRGLPVKDAARPLN